MKFTANFYFECNKNSIKVFLRNFRMSGDQTNVITKNYRVWNVFVQTSLLIVSLALIVHIFMMEQSITLLPRLFTNVKLIPVTRLFGV